MNVASVRWGTLLKGSLTLMADRKREDWTEWEDKPKVRLFLAALLQTETAAGGRGGIEFKLDPARHEEKEARNFSQTDRIREKFAWCHPRHSDSSRKSQVLREMAVKNRRRRNDSFS